MESQGEMEKSAAILEMLEAVRMRLGPDSFDVLDYWPGDADTIGVALPAHDEPCVCIITAGKARGRYDLEHDGHVFRDCVIDGVESVIRHELRKQKQAQRAAKRGRDK